MSEPATASWAGPWACRTRTTTTSDREHREGQVRVGRPQTEAVREGPRRPARVERTRGLHRREQRCGPGEEVSERDDTTTAETQPCRGAPVTSDERGDHQCDEADDAGQLHERAEPGDDAALHRMPSFGEHHRTEHGHADEDVVARTTDDEHRDHRMDGEERHRAR